LQTPVFVFDIDDTLYSRLGLIGEIGEEILGSRLTVSREEFARVFNVKSNENFYLVESGRITPVESNVLRFRLTAEAFGCEVTEEECRRFSETYRYRQAHASLSPVLTQMMEDLSRAPVQLGVLTNGAPEHQRGKFRMLGLERWIPEKRAVVSGEEGCSKPDPALFTVCAQRLDAAPAQLWMIGDSFEHDIAGAQQAGWHSLWFNRCRRSTPEGAAAPDRVVYTEEELAKVCRELAGIEDDVPADKKGN